MNKKYFFFDIDGTLAENGVVPDSAKLTLKLLRENGHFCALATGRGSSTAWGVLDKYGFDNMVCDGGNGIVIDRKLISVTPLQRDKVLDLIDECERKNILWGFTPSKIDEVRYTKYQEFADKIDDKKYVFTVDPNINPRDFDEFYKAYVACSIQEEKNLEALKHLPWIRFFGEVIFVEPINKAFGIKKMVDYLGGDYKDVVVFGDEKNDLSMFIPEWTCIAMGNAIEDIKKVANYVTDDIHHDGIYNACKHFNWI